MEITTNTIELSSSCTCETYDDDDNLIAADNCYGCYNDELEYLQGELEHWAKANGYNDETIIRVNFSGVSWQRVSGYGDITLSDIPNFLELNGDFRIVFDLTPDYLTLTARRYSHDEPVGTGLITFTKSPLAACVACGSVAECSPIDGDPYCTECY